MVRSERDQEGTRRTPSMSLGGVSDTREEVKDGVLCDNKIMAQSMICY